MGKATDFSGRWRGFYEQGGSRHGISMIVAQRGQSVMGRMRDDDTLLTMARPQHLILEPDDFDETEDGAQHGGPDGRLQHGLQDGLQDGPPGGLHGGPEDAGAASTQPRTVQLESIASLPEFSAVEGDAIGDHLSFEKRYLGPHEISTWIDGHAEAHYTLNDHRVRYEGSLDDTGELLIGRWLLGPPEAPHMTGRFELRREAPDAHGPAT